MYQLFQALLTNLSWHMVNDSNKAWVQILKQNTKYGHACIGWAINVERFD